MGLQDPAPITPVDIHRSLGRVEGKLDALLDAMTPLEKRVGSLERSRAWVMGGAAAIGAGVTAFLQKAGLGL